MDDQSSDRELAHRVVAHGDEMAFRALYRRHAPAVYRFLLRLTGGNDSEAEDLMQDTWLRAARGLAGFHWESAFRSWVTGIALNRFRELARRNGRRITEVEGEWEAAAGAGDAAGRIDLERALQLLPPGFRTVLVLHDVEGFTHEEIGAHLGIAHGTSKSQLHRARRAMRRLLGVGLEMA
jgi:RNA polymerase sigma-70 factor (ECF subfamily)